jgi:threonylcarbamoyladenosine tRNA methylthiotransferase MtaB
MPLLGLATQMATFHIENFGCRATQADAAAIERQLLERGFGRAGVASGASVVVVSTCTVTASADAQARQAIRHFHRENPSARILVTGCYAQRAPEELAQVEGVTWVVGNSHLLEIPRLLDEPPFAERSSEGFFPLERLAGDPFSLGRGPAKILTGNIFERNTVFLGSARGDEGGRTRPVLKIQDGCSNRCAYCVIPFVRGRSRSLPTAEVLAEVRRLADAGAKEVVLSGINLGSYGRDLAPRIGLCELLRRILEETSLERLRLSSIEPMDVTQELIDLVASTGRLARHFHIPLQSGSDRVLAAMRRWYRAAHYTRRVELIGERLPDAAVGADIIVGFPGETDADHRATVELVERLPFTYLHVFAFSERPGTEAAKMTGEVPAAVAKARSRELRALAAEKKAKFQSSQAGTVQRVLTLHRCENGCTEAISSNYLTVRVPGHWPANEWLNVRLRMSDGNLIGQPLIA